jgi:hypothetical protein
VPSDSGGMWARGVHSDRAAFGQEHSVSFLCGSTKLKDPSQSLKDLECHFVLD